MKEKVIIALDVNAEDKALEIVEVLAEAEVFKVGLRLFSARGPQFLTKLKDRGKKVFLDLKLHDIPSTVASAVREMVRQSLFMITLHASGGREMLARAAEEAEREAAELGIRRPYLLAVTILTSLKGKELEEIGMKKDVPDQVLRLAWLARESGMDGVVCSPQEIGAIRKGMGKDFLIVTPGIRLLGAVPDDQKRIMTPAQAIRQGADYLVLGRPVIEAASPREAFFRILEELDAAVDSADSKDRP